MTNLDDNVLEEFAKWTPVLAGDKAFKSKGHGGITVRSYLSPTLVEHLNTSSKSPYPLPRSAMLAKAVVATETTPAAEASRVYFMIKQPPGFDPENGDWSYALAVRKNGSLELDPSVTPKFAPCVSCHVKFKQFDNAQTVDFYRRGAAE